MIDCKATNIGVKNRWKVTTYELISFELTQDWLAVICCEDHEGAYLSCYKIDAIGLAIATTRTHERVGQYGYRIVAEDDPTREMVGLCCADGSFDICNSSNNFAGLCRTTDDPAFATGELNVEYLRKLPDDPKQIRVIRSY